MAYEFPILVKSFTAYEDLSSYQYHFVHQEDDRNVSLLDSTSEEAIGVLQNAPEEGEQALVMIIGISKVKAGAGGLARGDKVTPEYIGAADCGKGIATTTGGDPINGTCIMAAGAEDDLASVLLTGPSFYAKAT